MFSLRSGCCLPDGHCAVSRCREKVFSDWFSETHTAPEFTATGCGSAGCQNNWQSTSASVTQGHSYNTKLSPAQCKLCPLFPLPLFWLVKIPWTFLHNWHTGWIPVTSASVSTIFSHLKMQAVRFSEKSEQRFSTWCQNPKHNHDFKSVSIHSGRIHVYPCPFWQLLTRQQYDKTIIMSEWASDKQETYTRNLGLIKRSSWNILYNTPYCPCTSLSTKPQGRIWASEPISHTVRMTSHCVWYITAVLQ